MYTEVGRGSLWLSIDSRPTRTMERLASPETSCLRCLSQSDRRPRWIRNPPQLIGIRRRGKPCTGSSSHAVPKKEGTNLRRGPRSRTAHQTEWSLSRQNRCTGSVGPSGHSNRTKGRGGSRWPVGVSRVCQLIGDALTITRYRVIVKGRSARFNFEGVSRGVLQSEIAAGRPSTYRCS